MRLPVTQKAFQKCFVPSAVFGRTYKSFLLKNYDSLPMMRVTRIGLLSLDILAFIFLNVLIFI